MFTINELWAMNKGLDAKPIFGLGKETGISQSAFVDGKKGLIEKKVLKPDGGISPLGFHAMRTLEQYKKAPHYIFVNDYSLSLDQTDFIVLLQRTGEDNYNLMKSAKHFAVLGIVRALKFLWDCEEPAPFEKRVPYLDFFSDFFTGLPEDEVFFLKKYAREDGEIGKTLDVVFLKKEGICYRYDVASSRLRSVNPKTIRLELLSVFEMGEKHVNV